jgi:ATP-dependent exoDNAse (exonuclease V) alpha subunit
MIVSLPDGTHRTMSPRRLSGKGWSLGVVEDLEVAAGERVRFTGTDSSAGYRNREHGVVEEISADALAVRRSDGSTVRLARDRVLSVDYSYAVTGHSAQGLDVSRVVLEKDTHSRTTHRRAFYTDLTRARDAAVVVTDSMGQLAKRVRSDLLKVAALDVVGSVGFAVASGHELG